MNRARVIAKIKKFTADYKTQLEAARALEISPQYLSDILLGRRQPPDSVLTILGIEKVEAYRSAR